MSITGPGDWSNAPFATLPSSMCSNPPAARAHEMLRDGLEQARKRGTDAHLALCRPARSLEAEGARDDCGLCLLTLFFVLCGHFLVNRCAHWHTPGQS